MRVFFFFLFSFFFYEASAQYAPQAGLFGSTAISGASSRFAGWATQCTVQRGFMNIANPALGYASAGDSSLALGPADDMTVSLGDSGVAVVTFAHPIYNGTGADFAVFENGFRDATDSTLAFLELGFVEVSSDGVNYFRFPATSLTQDNVQIGNDNYIDAADLNNLAGKYIAKYGTPFDLEELSGTSGLDINNVTHVRVIDVVGSISGHSTYDSAGRIINDPYPTPFPSCGFDLDAVGVINEAYEGVKEINGNVTINVYPNPATDKIIVSVTGIMADGMNATLMSITGSMMQQEAISQGVNSLSMEQYPVGMYYLELRNANGRKWVEIITKR